MTIKQLIRVSMFSFLLANLVVATGSSQVWHPNSSVPYSPQYFPVNSIQSGTYAIPSPPLPVYGTTVAPHGNAFCSCGCGGNGRCVANPGNCELCIYPGKICCRKTTKPIHVAPPKFCESDIENKKFYCGEEKCPGTTKVPKKIKCCAEKYRFERKKYTICGCCLEICVPCAIDCVVSEECKPVSTTVEMVAKIRCDSPGRADIWVFNVVGLPSQAVLALNVTSSEANRRFGTSFGY